MKYECKIVADGLWIDGNQPTKVYEASTPREAAAMAAGEFDSKHRNFARSVANLYVEVDGVRHIVLCDMECTYDAYFLEGES